MLLHILKVHAPGLLQNTAMHDQQLIKKLFNQNFSKKVNIKWIFDFSQWLDDIGELIYS